MSTKKVHRLHLNPVNSLVIFTLMAKPANADGLSAGFQQPSTAMKPDSSFFTFTEGRSLAGSLPPTEFKALLADENKFPALDGLGVSLAVLRFPAGAVNPPHIHRGATELLLLVSCALQVGFVDQANRLFNQRLQAGDMFAFPQGLLHFHFNHQAGNKAIAIAAYGSSDPGLANLPGSLFNAGIDDGILARSFKTDVLTIQRLKASAVEIAPPKTLN